MKALTLNQKVAELVTNVKFQVIFSIFIGV